MHNYKSSLTKTAAECKMLNGDSTFLNLIIKNMMDKKTKKTTNLLSPTVSCEHHHACLVMEEVHTIFAPPYFFRSDVILQLGSTENWKKMHPWG